MDDIEVEAVEELSAGTAPTYVLYGGKGGVGKTTMAAATGLASASAGTKTLVVSTDPAHSLSDVFDTAIGGDPTSIDWIDSLYAVEIDPDQAMQQTDLFGEGGDLTMGGFGDLLGDDGDNVTMPGADEAAAIQQLMRFLDDDRFDRVIVDTAPTGHTLRLLELPDVLDSMLGRFLQFRERLGDLIPGTGDDDTDSMAIGDLRDRVDRLESVLRDPEQTDFRLVMVPDELSVRETTRLRERLAETGIPVGSLVVNRVMEPPEAVLGETGSEFVAPNLDECSFCQRRWQVQQDALDSAQPLFRGVDVYRVPLLGGAVRGQSALEVVATCLD